MSELGGNPEDGFSCMAHFIEWIEIAKISFLLPKSSFSESRKLFSKALKNTFNQYMVITTNYCMYELQTRILQILHSTITSFRLSEKR